MLIFLNIFAEKLYKQKFIKSFLAEKTTKLFCISLFFIPYSSCFILYYLAKM